MNDLVALARALAEEWHAGEIRKFTEGEAYIVHPIAVANLVAEVSSRWELQAAAYLHDVLECPDDLRRAREAVILQRLGQDVLDLVHEVTNPSRPSDGNRAVRKALDRAHLAKASPDGQTLRLADAVDNFSSLEQRSPRFAVDYAVEKQLILPLTTEGAPALHARLTTMIERILHR